MPNSTKTWRCNMNINTVNRSLMLWDNGIKNKEATLYSKDGNNEKDKRDGKVEVVTVNGRTKTYLVLADGKRILIADEVSKDQLQQNVSSQEQKESNASETMEFLNHLLGVGSSSFVGFQVSNLQEEKSYGREEN